MVCGDASERKPCISALRGLLLFPLSPRWGDDQFLGGLYFLPFLHSLGRWDAFRRHAPVGGLFLFLGVSHEKWSMVIENDCARSFSFSLAEKAAPGSPPKGAAGAGSL